MPELFLGLENKNNSWIVGAGAELKKIVPRTSAKVGTNEYKVDESLLSYGASVYGQYSKALFTIKAKTTYGQNLSDLSMLGGYGVSSVDTVSGKQTYTSFNVLSAWINATYGKKWQVGLFGGYTQNLGADKSLYDNAGALSLYGNGISGNQMIGTMYKISPEISYNLPNLKIGVEYDYTVAEWGSVSQSDGIVRHAKDVLNQRMLGFIAYYF
jgi:hypothetical protein